MFLSAGVHDDSAGVLETYGTPKIRSGTAAFVHGLTTAGGMITVIDGLLSAALAGVVAIYLGADLAVAFLVGGIAFVALFAVLNRYAYNVIGGFEATYVSRFPTSTEPGGDDKA